MKLRTTGNSLRIRVRKSDLAIMAEQGFVKEEIHLPGGNCFLFELRPSEETTTPTASLHEGKLSIILPLDLSKQWVASTQVGIEHYQNLPGGEKLHILVEKDFACGHRDAGEIKDYFPELKPKS